MCDSALTLAQNEHTCVNSFARLKAAHTMHWVADTGRTDNDLREFAAAFDAASKTSGRFR